MKAGGRWTIAIVAVGLAFASARVSAQEADQPAAPATETIGPRDLQNFNLQGTVTRSADTPAPATQSTPPATRAANAEARPARSQTRQAASAESREAPAERRTPTAQASSTGPSRATAETSRPHASITAALPPISTGLSGNDEAPANPGFAQEDVAAPSLAPEHRMALWPWLLAAMALGAGGAFLFWRHQHGRHAFAGGPQADAFVAPEAGGPRPRHAPSVPPPAAPASNGLVASRLRPWLDISFEPLRCVVEDQQVTFEFQLALQNTGTGPARNVLIEACMINASPTQEEEINNFFVNPAGKGERIAAIPPLKSVELRPRVVVGVDQLRILDAGGRKVFVPLLAFNALYRWGSGEGQTSGVYLLGRDNKGDKLAPFRLDLGPRLFRGVEARPLPQAVRS